MSIASDMISHDFGLWVFDQHPFEFGEQGIFSFVMNKKRYASFTRKRKDHLHRL